MGGEAAHKGKELTKTEERLPEDVGKGIDWIDKEIAEYPGGWAQLQIDFPPSTDTTVA